MKALIQRVKTASVEIDGKIVSKIGQGLLVLLGVVKGDEQVNAEFLADKLLKLRIFEDENGKMNRSLVDVGGEMLVADGDGLGGMLIRHGGCLLAVGGIDGTVRGGGVDGLGRDRQYGCEYGYAAEET